MARPTNAITLKDPELSEDVTLDQYAERLRDAYVTRVRQRTGNGSWGKGRINTLDGGTSRHGVKHAGSLMPAAKILQDRGIDPAVMIRLRMPAWDRSQPPPMSFFTGDEAFECYAGGVKVLAAHLTTEFETWYRVFELLVISLSRVLLDKGRTHDQIVRMALQDPTRLTAHALFRYCVATQLGFTDIASAYEAAATRLYAASPEAYDEAWGTTIPERLKQLIGVKGVADG